jgi:hypothetical protein
LLCQRVRRITRAKERDGWANDFFWCNRTLTEIGEDDKPVHPNACKSCRACFEE